MECLKLALLILDSKCNLKVTKIGISFQCKIGDIKKEIKFDIIKNKLMIPKKLDSVVSHYTYHYERILRKNNLLNISDDKLRHPGFCVDNICVSR